jgi:hypothetical protein
MTRACRRSVEVVSSWNSWRVRGQRVSAYFPFSLLVLPFLVLSRNSNPVFSGLGYIDPWVYYGFFRNLVLFKREFFPGTYYGSRLSWILPGYLLNQVFEPLAANYVLHLTVYYAAVFSLYFILARTINRPTALLTAIVFGLHPYVWLATGGDYPDGASIGYYLLATALLTYAGYQPRRRWTLILAGVCCGALVYCNVAWIVFAPFFPAYYLFRRRVHSAASHLVEFGRFCLWAGAGAAALTALLGAINYRLDHNFWFYAPSLEFVANNAGKPNPFKANGLHWVGGAKWLFFPGLLLLAVPLALARRLRGPFSAETRASLFFAVSFLFNAAIFALAEVCGTPMLQYHYYASLLLPSAFLSCGALLLRLDEGWGLAQLVTSAAAAIVLAVPWWDMDGHFWRMTANLGALWVVGFAAGGPVLWRSLQPGSRAALVTLLLAMAACGALVPWMDKSFMRAGSWHTGTEARDGFLRINEALNYIQAAKPDRGTRFWFDDREPDALEFISMSSVYLYGYTLLGRSFPSLPGDVQISGGSLLVIPSHRPDVVDLVRKAFAPRHMIPALVCSNTIERNGVRYSLHILRVERDPNMLQPLTLRSDGELAPAPPGLSADALPRENWVLAGNGGSAEPTALGLAVTTVKDRWGFAVYYNVPLAATADGTYLFTLRFKLLSGRITFGALKLDRSAWVAQAGEPVRRGDYFIAECAVPLKAGQRIWLQTENNQPIGDRPSAFVIQEIKAYHLQ